MSFKPCVSVSLVQKENPEQETDERGPHLPIRPAPTYKDTYPDGVRKRANTTLEKSNASFLDGAELVSPWKSKLELNRNVENKSEGQVVDSFKTNTKKGCNLFGMPTNQISTKVDIENNWKHADGIMKPKTILINRHENSMRTEKREAELPLKVQENNIISEEILTKNAKEGSKLSGMPTNQLSTKVDIENNWKHRDRNMKPKTYMINKHQNAAAVENKEPEVQLPLKVQEKNIKSEENFLQFESGRRLAAVTGEALKSQEKLVLCNNENTQDVQILGSPPKLKEVWLAKAQEEIKPQGHHCEIFENKNNEDVLLNEKENLSPQADNAKWRIVEGCPLPKLVTIKTGEEDFNEFELSGKPELPSKVKQKSKSKKKDSKKRKKTASLQDGKDSKLQGKPKMQLHNKFKDRKQQENVAAFQNPKMLKKKKRKERSLFRNPEIHHKAEESKKQKIHVNGDEPSSSDIILQIHDITNNKWGAVEGSQVPGMYMNNQAPPCPGKSMPLLDNELEWATGSQISKAYMNCQAPPCPGKSMPLLDNELEWASGSQISKAYMNCQGPSSPGNLVPQLHDTANSLRSVVEGSQVPRMYMNHQAPPCPGKSMPLLDIELEWATGSQIFKAYMNCQGPSASGNLVPQLHDTAKNLREVAEGSQKSSNNTKEPSYSGNSEKKHRKKPKEREKAEESIKPNTNGNVPSASGNLVPQLHDTAKNLGEVAEGSQKSSNNTKEPSYSGNPKKKHRKKPKEREKAEESIKPNTSGNVPSSSGNLVPQLHNTAKNLREVAEGSQKSSNNTKEPSYSGNSEKKHHKKPKERKKAEESIKPNMNGNVPSSSGKPVTQQDEAQGNKELKTYMNKKDPPSSEKPETPPHQDPEVDDVNLKFLPQFYQPRM